MIANPVPHAPRCEVRGDGLRAIVAHEPAQFNVTFRDVLGQLAHACELDVCVQRFVDAHTAALTAKAAAAAANFDAKLDALIPRRANEHDEPSDGVGNPSILARPTSSSSMVLTPAPAPSLTVEDHPDANEGGVSEPSASSPASSPAWGARGSPCSSSRAATSGPPSISSRGSSPPSRGSSPPSRGSSPPRTSSWHGSSSPPASSVAAASSLASALGRTTTAVSMGALLGGLDDVESFVTGPEPLVVSRAPELESEVVGELPAGRTLRVLRLRRLPEGDVLRACVALGGLMRSGGLESWREMYPSRQAWRARPVVTRIHAQPLELPTWMRSSANKTRNEASAVGGGGAEGVDGAGIAETNVGGRSFVEGSRAIGRGGANGKAGGGGKSKVGAGGGGGGAGNRGVSRSSGAVGGDSHRGEKLRTTKLPVRTNGGRVQPTPQVSHRSSSLQSSNRQLSYRSSSQQGASRASRVSREQGAGTSLSGGDSLREVMEVMSTLTEDEDEDAGTPRPGLGAEPAEGGDAEGAEKDDVAVWRPKGGEELTSPAAPLHPNAAAEGNSAPSTTPPSGESTVAPTPKSNTKPAGPAAQRLTAVKLAIKKAHAGRKGKSDDKPLTAKERKQLADAEAAAAAEVEAEKETWRQELRAGGKICALVRGFIGRQRARQRRAEMQAEEARRVELAALEAEAAARAAEELQRYRDMKLGPPWLYQRLLERSDREQPSPPRGSAKRDERAAGRDGEGGGGGGDTTRSGNDTTRSRRSEWCERSDGGTDVGARLDSDGASTGRSQNLDGQVDPTEAASVTSDGLEDASHDSTSGASAAFTPPLPIGKIRAWQKAPQYGWVTISTRGRLHVGKQVARVPGYLRQQHRDNWSRRQAIDEKREHERARQRDLMLEEELRTAALAAAKAAASKDGALGMQWARQDYRPLTGTLLVHAQLSSALASGKTKFTHEEWKSFAIDTLRLDCYIRVPTNGARWSDVYYKPVSAGLASAGKTPRAKSKTAPLDVPVPMAMSGSGGGGAPHSTSSPRSQRPHTTPYQQELETDPKRIGFAYGGVSPGRKGSSEIGHKGMPVESHTVSFSVGIVGTYLLHVGLRPPSEGAHRPQSLPLPGSPFKLTVTPGVAHALSTQIPPSSLPLQGQPEQRDDGFGGLVDGFGCVLKLRAHDKMGNICDTGGAKVTCSAVGAAMNAPSNVVCSTSDEGNGWYRCTWWSKDPGLHRAVVKMDGLHVVGSPCLLILSASGRHAGRQMGQEGAELHAEGGGADGAGGAQVAMLTSPTLNK